MTTSTFIAKATTANLRDGSDLTYEAAGGNFAIDNADPGVYTPYRLVSLQPYVRVKADVAGTIGVRLVGTGAKQRAIQQQVAVTTGYVTINLSPISAWGHGVGFTLSDFAALTLETVNVTGAANMRVAEAGVTVNYKLAPRPSGVAITAPPLLTTNRVRGQWTYADPTDDPQIAFQERIYKRPAGYNLLDDRVGGQQSTFEADVAGFVNVSGAVLAVSTQRKASGASSMRLHASAAANMEAASSGYVFLADQLTTYTVMAKFGAGTVGRTCRVGMKFTDDVGTVTTTATSSVTDTTGDPFTMARVAVTSPARCVSGYVRVFIVSGTAGEEHYVDEVAVIEGDVALFPGPGTRGWPPPVGSTTEPATPQFNTANREIEAFEAAGLEPVSDVIVYSDSLYSDYRTLSAGAYRRYIRTLGQDSLTWSDWVLQSPASYRDFQVACYRAPAPGVQLEALS